MRIFAGVPREGDVKCNAMLWAYTRVHTFNKKMVRLAIYYVLWLLKLWVTDKGHGVWSSASKPKRDV